MNLLRAGRIFTFEPPPGVKANLIRTFNTIPASRMMKAPNERARLYLLLAWFHAIVQERLRYCPLGKSMCLNSQNISYLLLNYLFIKYQNFICASPREKADELEFRIQVKK